METKNLYVNGKRGLDDWPLLTYRQAAEILGVAPVTLRGWVHQQTIGCIKLGPGPKARVRFRPQDIEDFLVVRPPAAGSADR